MKTNRFFFYFYIAFFCFAIQLFGHNFDEKQLLKDFCISLQIQPSWIAELNKRGVLSRPTENVKFPISSRKAVLFRYYPALEKNLPYIALGDLPTPVTKLNALGSTIGVSSLYIKRDDLTGALDEFGNRSYGGNKVRKLEFLLAQAVAYQAKTILTFGCVGSNHAVATALYAKQLGLQCIAMLKPQPNSCDVRKNLLRHLYAGTHLYYYPSNDIRYVGTLLRWLEHKNLCGDFPYVIPTGGSSPLGAIGFVNAAFELKDQIKAGQLPEPDLIYVPCGSYATAAGLILGTQLAGLKSRVVAMMVEPGEGFGRGIVKLIRETNILLHELDNGIPLLDITESDVAVNVDFSGLAYGLFTQEGMEARSLLHSTEGLEVDGTYAAKAFAGCLHDAQKKENKNKIILFWNTFGGNCGLHQMACPADYATLPHCFHAYFEEDVQELDNQKM